MLAYEEPTFIVPLVAPRSLNWTRAKGEAPSHQSARRAGSSCGSVIRHIEARAGTPAAPTHDRNLSRVNSRCPRPSIGRERGVRSRAENIARTLTSTLPEGVLPMPCAHRTRRRGGNDAVMSSIHFGTRCITRASATPSRARASPRRTKTVRTVAWRGQHFIRARSHARAGVEEGAHTLVLTSTHTCARAKKHWRSLFWLAVIRRSRISRDAPLRFRRCLGPWRGETEHDRVWALNGDGD